MYYYGCVMLKVSWLKGSTGKQFPSDNSNIQPIGRASFSVPPKWNLWNRSIVDRPHQLKTNLTTALLGAFSQKCANGTCIFGK